MSRGRELAVAAAAAALLVFLNTLLVSSALGFIHKPRRVLETDHFRYIAMAEAPPGAAADPRAREAPFCWRVLAPAVVHALVRLGVPLHVGFWASTQLFLALFLFTLFVSLRARGFALAESLAGIALAALMPGAVRWYAYQYWMPDPLCLFLVTLGLHLARTDRRLALSLVSVAGVLTRESYAIVVVFALLLWLRTQGPRGALVRGALVFGLALAALALLRLGVVPAAGTSLVAAAREMLAFRARHLFDNQLYFMTLGSLGVLVPLVALRARGLARFLRERYEEAAVVAVAYASLAFANNTDRLLAYALPVVIPAGLRSAAALAAVVGLPRLPMLASVLAVQAFVYAATPFHGSMGLSVYQPVRWSVVVVLAAVFGAAALALRRGRTGQSS